MIARRQLLAELSRNGTAGPRPSRKEALQQLVRWLEREGPQSHAYEAAPAYRHAHSSERLDQLKLEISGLLRKGHRR